MGTRRVVELIHQALKVVERGLEHLEDLPGEVAVFSCVVRQIEGIEDHEVRGVTHHVVHLEEGP